jgi:hypothetical protein
VPAAPEHLVSRCIGEKGGGNFFPSGLFRAKITSHVITSSNREER